MEAITSKDDEMELLGATLPPSQPKKIRSSNIRLGNNTLPGNNAVPGNSIVPGNNMANANNIRHSINTALGNIIESGSSFVPVYNTESGNNIGGGNDARRDSNIGHCNNTVNGRRHGHGGKLRQSTLQFPSVRETVEEEQVLEAYDAEKVLENALGRLSGDRRFFFQRLK